MSTTMSDEPLGPLPRVLSDRQDLMRMLRDNSRGTQESMDKLWRRQATSLNRFSKALEGLNKPHTDPARSGILSGLFGNKSNAPLGSDKAISLLGNIKDDTQDEVHTLGEIHQLLQNDSERQNKRDLLNAQVADDTLKTLKLMLKALGHSSGGGELLEGLLAGKGLGGVLGRRGGVSALGRTALSAERGVASTIARRPGLISRMGSAAAELPGVAPTLRAGRALAGLPAAGFNKLPGVAQTGLRAGGRALGGAAKFAGRGLGAAGVAGAPLAAMAMPSILNDVSETRGTPLMGNEQTGGLMGSRMSNYAQAALTGGMVGGSIGGPIGAAIGGLSGLGLAAYTDFKPQIDKFSSKVLDYVGSGMSKLWDGLSTLTSDVFSKFPKWIISKIPSWEEIKARLAKLGHGMAFGSGPRMSPDKPNSGTAPTPDGGNKPATSIAGRAFSSIKNWFTGGPKPEIAGGTNDSKSTGSNASTITANIPTEGKGLLDTIATGESHGDYSIRQGGREHITDFSQHPGTVAAGGVSTAAGKYQFIKSTWDEAAKATGVKDFSPESQDKAAWWLAQRDYNKHTKRNLSEDLKSKDPAVQAGIATALNKTWTSLPGGGDATQTGGRKTNEYLANLAKNTEKYQVADAKSAETQKPTTVTKATSATDDKSLGINIKSPDNLGGELTQPPSSTTPTPVPSSTTPTPVPSSTTTTPVPSSTTTSRPLDDTENAKNTELFRDRSATNTTPNTNKPPTTSIAGRTFSSIKNWFGGGDKKSPDNLAGESKPASANTAGSGYGTNPRQWVTTSKGERVLGTTYGTPQWNGLDSPSQRSNVDQHSTSFRVPNSEVLIGGSKFTGTAARPLDDTENAKNTELFRDRSATNTRGTAVAQSPTGVDTNSSNILAGSNAARRDAFTERASLAETGPAAGGFEKADESPGTSTPPVSNNSASASPKANVDLDTIPMMISDNGMVFVNTNSMA